MFRLRGLNIMLGLLSTYKILKQIIYSSVARYYIILRFIIFNHNLYSISNRSKWISRFTISSSKSQLTTLCWSPCSHNRQPWPVRLLRNAREYLRCFISRSMTPRQWTSILRSSRREHNRTSTLEAQTRASTINWQPNKPSKTRI